MMAGFVLKIGNYSFPAVDAGIYLNHAGVAPLSGVALEALCTYAKQASQSAYVGWDWYDRCNQIKNDLAKLIGAADGHSIAFVPNTSTGLNLVANGIDWQQGDSVVVTAAEYPANRYVWDHLAKRGVKVIVVSQVEHGVIEVDRLCDAIENKTRIVSISHVQYSSGFCIDLKPISQRVHQAGGYLCVDGIQSVGVMPVDVVNMGIDFFTADGHKWLLGPEGAGFFYCRPDLLEWLEPSVVGWLNVVNPFDFGTHRFEFAKTARRFEAGTYNIGGQLALGASVAMMLDLGIENIWQKVLSLTDYLCQGLIAKGYHIFSPRDQGQKSGIVVFEKQSLPNLDSIIHELNKEAIVIVSRGGRLRASPHFYNTYQQLDALLALLP